MRRPSDPANLWLHANYPNERHLPYPGEGRNGEVPIPIGPTGEDGALPELIHNEARQTIDAEAQAASVRMIIPRPHGRGRTLELCAPTLEEWRQRQSDATGDNGSQQPVETAPACPRVPRTRRYVVAVIHPGVSTCWRGYWEAPGVEHPCQICGRQVDGARHFCPRCRKQQSRKKGL